MWRVAVAVVAGLFLLAPAAAQVAQEAVDAEKEEFTAIFEDRMAERLGELREEGVSLERIGELWVDHLDAGTDGEGASAREVFTFSGGKDGQYLVMALCDYDCSDIDLHLYGNGQGVDAKEEPLESDTEEDAEPLLLPGLLGEPLEDDDYEVEIRMYSCEEVYCYFAVGIYRLQEDQEEDQED